MKNFFNLRILSKYLAQEVEYFDKSIYDSMIVLLPYQLLWVCYGYKSYRRSYFVSLVWKFHHPNISKTRKWLDRIRLSFVLPKRIQKSCLRWCHSIAAEWWKVVQSKLWELQAVWRINIELERIDSYRFFSIRAPQIRTCFLRNRKTIECPKE